MRLAYGMWAYRRVGSIAAGSNVLQLTGLSSLGVGDPIIIEVGGEAGKGLFGTMGVGGVLPAATDGWSTFYYRSKDLPLALMAKVTAVADGGKTLTLDKAAAIASTNANVYFDNYPLLDAVLKEDHPAGWAVTLPSGDFAISDKLGHFYHGGWTIAGAGKGITILRSPKGAPSGGIWCFETDDTELRDFTIVGNAGQNGFGLKDHGDWVELGGIGVLITKGANCIIRNVSCFNVFRKAGWGEYTIKLQIADCDFAYDDAHMGYVEWWFGVSDSRDATIARCKIDSKYLIPGFETFRSDNVKFIDCVSKNGVFSSNSSGNFLLENLSLTVTAGSRFSDASFSGYNPGVNINSNIQPPNEAMSLGGLIKNIRLDVQGAVNADGNFLKGIIINSDNPNVTVDGGLITYPDQTSPTEIGPFGVNSTGQNTTVQNLTVTGKPFNSWEANIKILNGVVTGCTAYRIIVNGVEQA